MTDIFPVLGRTTHIYIIFRWWILRWQSWKFSQSLWRNIARWGREFSKSLRAQKGESLAMKGFLVYFVSSGIFWTTLSLDSCAQLYISLHPCGKNLLKGKKVQVSDWNQLHTFIVIFVKFWKLVFQGVERRLGSPHDFLLQITKTRQRVNDSGLLCASVLWIFCTSFCLTCYFILFI